MTPTRLALVGVALTLVVLGGAVAAYKFSLIRDIRYIGHADEAAYAEMGRALVAGRGFNVHHVSVFFHAYDPGITRREDHWPPLMGMLIAPFLLLFGHETWAAKLPAILVGSIGLPLATMALAVGLSGRAWAGLVAGLAMLADVTLFTESLKTLSDVTLAAVVTAWLACLVAGGGGRHRWLHLPAGVFAAAAFYAKGSHLILLALWPAATGLIEGWRALARPWLYAGIATALLLMAPWLIANWIEYGRPLHSTQNHVAAYIGLERWEPRFYRPHWDQDLPRLSDRWRSDPQRYWNLVARQRESFTRFALLGPRSTAESWKTWSQPWTQHDPIAAGATLIAGATLMGVALASLGVAAWRMVQRRRRRGAAGDLPWSPHRLLGSLTAVMGVGLAQWAFVVHLWEAMPRLALVFLPSIAAVAATGLALLADLPLQWTTRSRDQLARWHWIAAPPLCVLCLVLVWHQAGTLKAYHRSQVNSRAHPYGEQPFYPQMGDWMSDHLPPGSVVMCRNPWELRWYVPDPPPRGRGFKAVALPYAEPMTMMWIARYYGVTHYLDDQRWQGMWRYLDGRHPAFVRVANAPGALYQINWSKLPEQELIAPGAAR